ESGCGKSVTAMSILRLIPEPPGKIAGAIRFEGMDLLKASDRDMRDIRGNDNSMGFEEPMTSLKPVVTVGREIAETRRLHQNLGVVAEVAEEVVVMYAGRIVVRAPVEKLLRTPRHPYTQVQLGALPKLGSSLTGQATRLAENPGVVPGLKHRIPGCVFASRCA